MNNRLWMIDNNDFRLEGTDNEINDEILSKNVINSMKNHEAVDTSDYSVKGNKMEEFWLIEYVCEYFSES